MANNLFNRTFTENKPKYLIQQLVFEVSRFELWGRWMKFNTPNKEAVNPNKAPMALSNTPIIVHRELQRMQGDSVKVPMIRNYDNLPTYGDEQLAGHEERQKINHKRVFLNLIRHAALPKSSTMQWQITKELDLAKWAKPQLQDHYAKVNARLGVTNAFYKGYSDNLLRDSNWYEGSDPPKAVSHPHIFVAGDGKVSYGTSDYPGTDGYETAVGTAVNTLGTTDLFNTSFLSALRSHDQIRKIPMLYTKDGTGYRIIVAHPYQLYDLVADSNFRSVMSTAQAGAKELAKDNPYLVGCKYFWEDWAIFDGGHLVWPVSVSGGKPVYGVESPTSLSDLEDFSTATAFGAIVIGDNAMSKATGSPMEFRFRSDDYDEVKGLAYRIVEGYARSDFWNEDDGAAGQYIVNDSSAIAITYAAAPTI